MGPPLDDPEQFEAYLDGIFGPSSRRQTSQSPETSQGQTCYVIDPDEIRQKVDEIEEELRRLGL